MRVPLDEALKKVSRARATGLGLALGLALVGAPALGDEVASVEHAEAPLLVVTVPEIAGSDVDDRAAGTVAVHVRESGARVKVVRHAGGALGMRRLLVDAQALVKEWDARGVIWIDVGRGSDAGVYLLERGASQIFGRKVAAPAAQVSAAIESLANIAGSAAAELLEGRVVGLAKVAIAATEEALPDAPVPEAPGASSAGAAPAPASAAPATTSARGTDAGPGASAGAPASAGNVEDPRATPNARPVAASSAPPRAQPPTSAPDVEGLRWPRLALSAGYTGNTFGLGVPWQSSVALFAAISPSRDGWIGLGYDVTFPQRIGDQHFSVELARHPIIVSGGYQFPLIGSLDFQIGARFTVDFVTLGFPPPPPSSPGAPRMPMPDSRLDVVLSAAPVLGVGFGITERVRASIFGGMDVPFTGLHAAPTGPFRGIEPAPARLLVGASLQVDVVVPGAALPVRAARR